MKKKQILIIKPQTTELILEKDIKIEMVGAKAMGLLEIPSNWGLPFFVISKQTFDEYRNSNSLTQKRIIKHIEKEVLNACDNNLCFANGKLILRSSGVEEGIKERGKYDSDNCDKIKIGEKIEEMYMKLINEKSESIAYIVQPYQKAVELGHLSNEIRIAKDRRDWTIEFEKTQKEESYNIGVRKWRRVYSYSALMDDNLACDSSNKIIEVLRKVAFYCTDNYIKNRIHLEFIWNGKQIFIVQLDKETRKEGGKNPKKEKILLENNNRLDNLKVFRNITISDKEKYDKIKNVFVYEELGLMKPPIYIISNRETIEKLHRGEIDSDIEEDLRELTARSLIIRTDVSKEETSDKQFFPRSNELRTLDAAKKWFQSKLGAVLEYQNPVIIAHVFIPAISSSFAYTSPHSKFVTIQSLWGLPEGLYYNSHDTVYVDLGTSDILHIDEALIDIPFRQCDYKNNYIAPDENGKWIEKETAHPYDWGISITDEQAKIIALGTLKIAQEIEKSVSVMWFVGVDSQYYGSECLPWFHEPALGKSFIQQTYKKKYFVNTEVEISSLEDWEKHKNNSNLKRIKLHPKEDKVLRDRNFLKIIGSEAKEKGVTILIEGTILAHPVYRLQETGVNILLAKANKEYMGTIQFDKLVRDLIPQKIQDNIENLVCYQAKGITFHRYLKEKLVEEAYEFIDADEDEKIEELADIYEVIITLKRCIDLSETILLTRKKVKLLQDKDNLLIKTDRISLTRKFTQLKGSYKDLLIDLSIERLHQNLELEVKISKFKKLETREKDTEEVEVIEKELLERIYDILDCENQKIPLQSKELENIVNRILNKMGVDKLNFDEICNQKRDKKGGFEKGYVLEQTKKYIISNEPENDEDFLRFEMGVIEENPYPELKKLLFHPKTYVDYRKKENEELLVRIKLPLCFERWDKLIEGEKVNEMLGLRSGMIIHAIREREKYEFSIYLRENTEQQISFDLKI